MGEEPEDGSEGARSERFVERIHQVTRTLVADHTFAGKLIAVAALAQRLLPGCDGAGIALRIRDQTHSVAVTNPLVLEVDLVQYDTGEGPCLAAIQGSHIVRVDILEADERFEHFAPGALDRGVRSVLSIPIDANDRTVGALNLYGGSADAFGPDAERVLVPIAAYAGEVIAASDVYAHSLELFDEILEELATTSMIDSAIGVLMAHTESGPDTARRMLEDAAEARDASLRDTAEAMLREQQGRPRDEAARWGADDHTEPDAPR